MNVLLTGATGYIGRRLKEKLLQDKNVTLRLFVRNARKITDTTRERVAIAEGDTFNKDSLLQALQGIDVAYYLIHSMGSKGDFEKLDRLSAENFRDACIQANVKRIIYLGGLGRKETASKHLASRLETGEILSARPDQIQTIWFRAAVIIGSGSASFEILRNLVEKLPLMTTPRWVSTKTQPIAVDDVLRYLFQGKDLKVEENLIVDIGSEQMSFRDMMRRAAKIMGLKRIIIPVPVLTPRLSSYWLILFTPVSYKIASALVEGLRSETVIQNDNAANYFPNILPLTFEEAVRKARADIEQNQVISRWCDSSAAEVCDIQFQDDISKAVFSDPRTYDFPDLSPQRVFHTLCSIGGKHGWFTYNFLWQLRGLVDKLLGGYGLNRGRRDPHELRIGDSLDFWKVVDIKENKRLLLLAQMKAPGKAWLEFVIDNHTLTQTAYFLPRGLWGRLYWHISLPFHALAFASLGRNIITHARSLSSVSL